MTEPKEYLKQIVKKLNVASPINPEIRLSKLGFCPTCGKELPEGKKYCSKECFYNRNKLVLNSDEVDPIKAQLEEEGIIDTNESQEFCEICGSTKYLGRCSKFTTHKAPKKPKSK